MSQATDILADGRLLIDRVSSIRRKHVLVQLAGGGSFAAVAALMGLGASMALDASMRLSYAARGTILFVVLLVVSAVLWRFLVRGLLRTPDVDQAALWAERVVPDADNRIISAVQLARRP